MVIYHAPVRMSRILPGPQDFFKTMFQPATCAGEMFRPNRAILLREQRSTLRQVDKLATYDNLVETTRKFQQGEFCPVQRRFGQVCPANLAQEPGNPTRSATDPWSISFDALPPAVWPMQRHKWLPMAAVLLLPCLAQVSPHQAARSPPRGVALEKGWQMPLGVLSMFAPEWHPFVTCIATRRLVVAQDCELQRIEEPLNSNLKLGATIVPQALKIVMIDPCLW